VNTLGATGYDYSSLATWEGDTDGMDLTATNAGLGTPCCPVIEAYESFTASALYIIGATTSSTYYRVLRAASGVRHLGNPSAGVVASQANSANTYVFQPGEAYFKTEDLRVELAADTTSTVTALPSGGNNAAVVGVLCTASNAGSGTALAISTGNSTAGVVRNCIAHSSEGAGFTGAGANIYLDNCTAANNGGLGFDGGTTGAVYRNCIGWNNTGGDFDNVSQSGTDYNFSKDATAPGTTTWTGQTADPFVDSANDDYRLAVGAAPIDLGQDLSATFDDDVAFTTRPAGSTWDLGAHEYPWQIARPDSTVLAGSWTATGAATLHAATNDQSDASYATAGSGVDDRMTLGFDTGIIAPEAGTVTLFVRLRRH
jgi:hypothetical protein